MGEVIPRPMLVDQSGVPMPKTPEGEPEEEKVEAKPVDEPVEDEDIQSKIDPIDHAIAEMLMMRPGITNVELGEMFDIHRDTIRKRRARPLFLRYIIFLRKPAVDIIHSAGKKASQRLVEALDYMKWATHKDPKTGKEITQREPDPWVRIAAVRLVTDISIARQGRGEPRGGTVIPGVPQEEVPELAKAFIATFREAEVVKRKELGPGKDPKKEEKDD